MIVTTSNLQLLDSASISLEKLLGETEGGDMAWSITSLEAVGNLGPEESMLDMESKISESDTGVTFSWDELVRFSRQVDQIINVCLVGKRTTTLGQSETDIAIELIDSSVWEIQTCDAELVSRLREKFA